MDKDIITEEVNAEYLKGLIYYVRGVRVMLDMDLAKIYGYSTKDFNRQVKNNIEKFEQDFMFQLTDEECEILRCKNSTSSWGGRRYNPYAFTEQGIYMLMTVLKGELATKQSKALIRIFKQMKDYIVDNQPLLGQREYLQLSLQTTQNTQDLLDLRKSLSAVDDKVASIIDTLGNVVTKSELANVMLDFSNPTVRCRIRFGLPTDLRHSQENHIRGGQLYRVKDVGALKKCSCRCEDYCILRQYWQPITSSRVQ